MANLDTRTKFEAWAAAYFLSIHRVGHGSYSAAATEIAWLAWQAAQEKKNG